MNNNTKILALDLGSNTGWAVSVNAVIESGDQAFTIKKGRKTIADDHPGEKFIQFQKWFRLMIRFYKPETVAYEEVMGYGMRQYAMNMYSGFRGIMLANCAYYEIPVIAYTQPAIKKFATGKGNANKEKMIEAAAMKWPSVAFGSHDEVDARFVLEMALCGL